MTKPAKLQFWPTTFYATRWDQHETEAPGLIELAYSLRDAQQVHIASGVAPAAKSSFGIYEGDFDFLNQDHPGVQKLKSFCIDQVQHAVHDIHGRQSAKDSIEVEILDSWFHITNGGGFHDAHFHGNCSWCGIYYLRPGTSGEKSGSGAPNGGNRFYSPLARGGGTTDYGNAYLNSSFIDPPIAPGMLLLFPSYLLHSGLPYHGAEDRVIVSFNSRSQLRQNN